MPTLTNINTRVIAEALASKTIAGLIAPETRVIVDGTKVLTDGAGNDQVDYVYAGRFTLAGAGAQSFDVSGSLEDLYGDAFVLTVIKALTIVNRSDKQATPTTMNLGITGNLWEDIVGGTSPNTTINAGGQLHWTSPRAGQAVTASTGDVITVTNLGASQAEFDIFIAGI